MELRDADKLMILMLSDIVRRLEIDDSVDPDLVQQAILGGHHWALDWQYDFLQAEPVKNDVVQSVVNTLDMWFFLELGYDHLSDADRAAVNDALPMHRGGPRFAGWDGNSETQYMSVARLLIQNMGRFEHFAGRELNSHLPSVDRYEAMYARFAPIRARIGENELTGAQIVEVIRRD